MRLLCDDDWPVCRKCGRVGVVPATCMVCNSCVYCKKKGHLVAKCFKAQPCSNCGEKGHPPKKCPKAWRIRPNLRRKITSPPKKKIRKRRPLNVSVTPPRHDDYDWRGLPYRDCVDVQPSLVFPDLRDLCTRMLQEVVNGTLPGSDCFPYKHAIETHGGISSVTKDLLSLVAPEIKDLQGQTITRNAFDSIRLKQNEPWPLHTGYLDYITDDRCYEYLRNYVGQSQESPRRIGDHSRSILHEKKNSLHYFIIWLGNGHRAANFLRLWSCPADDWDKWMELRFNLLEALFCCAFYSHHGVLVPNLQLIGSNTTKNVLTTGSGNNYSAAVRATLPPQTIQPQVEPSQPGLDDYSNLGYGLNIVSPLMQNAFMSEMAKLRYLNDIIGSEDKQIKGFLSFRVNIQNERVRVRKAPWLHKDYKELLEDIVGRNIFQDLKTSLDTPISDTPISESQLLNRNDLDATLFYGSLSAPIGFVLDYGIAAQEPDSNPSDHEDSGFNLPWVLDGSGFNQSNVLAWTFNFKRFSAFSLSELSGSFASDDATNQKLHKDILEASQLKVLLMCGPRAEEGILAAVKCGRRYPIELRGHRSHFYIGNGNSSIPTRLYIRCPEIPLQNWYMDGIYAARLSEIIKFAVLMSGVENIRPYFLEASTALNFIIRQAWRENQGALRMTTDTLDSGIRAWLARKGFADIEDIRKLERIAGSLTQGLLILTHTLPRRPGGGGGGSSARSSKRPKRKRGHFDPEMYETAKRHCQEVLKREGKFEKKTGEPLEIGINGSSISNDPTSEPQTPATVISDFFAIPKNKPDLVAETQELLFEQQEKYLVSLRQRVSPEELQEIEYLWADQEFHLSELKRLMVPIDFEDGLIVEDSDLVEPILYQRKTKGSSDSIKQKEWKLKNVIWRLEAGRFRGKLYPWVVPDAPEGDGKRQIQVSFCRITFPDDLDCGDNKIYVSIEICPEHMRHPHMYARRATDGDIAERLGIKIIGKDSTGQDFTFFPRVKRESAVFRANSFVDLLLGKNKEDIAKTPRRYWT